MPTSDKQARPSAVDVDVVKAIGHPLRMQLLVRLNEQVASPVELARELGESVQLVSYHVRILRDLGFVELVRTTPRRGAIEHHYRAIRRPFFSDEDYAALPRNTRAALAGGILQDIIKHAVHAYEAGSFEDNASVNLTTDNLVLDEQAWKELAVKVGEVYERALELQDEAAARIADGAESMDVRLSVLLYPRSEDSPASGNKPLEKPAGRKKKR